MVRQGTLRPGGADGVEQCKTHFQNGTYVTTTDGFDGFDGFGGYATAVNEKWKVDFVRPFDAGTDAKPTPWLTPATSATRR